MVEMIMAGVLDELSPGELADVCSWFTFDNDRRLNNRNVLNAHLVQVRRELWRIMQNIHDIEQQEHISITPNIIPDFHGVALSWSRGMSLNGLLRRIDLAEGDLLMLLNQTIDLLQQVQAAIGQVLDARDIWPQIELDETVYASKSALKRAKGQAEQLTLYREHLERLRPALAQASLLLIRGIIIQSRTVPSMVARIGDEDVPLDAEEDTEPSDIIEGV